MDERKTKIVACTLGLAAASTLGILSFKKDRPSGSTLRIVEQSSGTDHSPVAGFPPGIVFRTEPSLDEIISDDANRTIEVRDANGRRYPVTKYAGQGGSFGWIPFGYTKTPVKPTLLLRKDGQIVERVAMRSFPPPVPVSLTPSPNAPVRLSREGDDLVVTPLWPVPRGETWSVSVVSTPSAPVLGGWFGPSISGDSSEPGRMRLPYPDEIPMVRIEIIVRRKHILSEDLRLSDMRLVKRQGETILQLPKPTTLKNSLGVRLEARSQQEQRRSSSIDHRSPSLPIEMTRLDKPSLSYPNVRNYSLAIVSPTPESLNLSSLTIGGARGIAQKKPPGAPIGRPFTAVLRLSLTEDRLVSTRRYVVPVMRSTAPGKPPGPIAHPERTYRPFKAGSAPTP